MLGRLARSPWRLVRPDARSCLSTLQVESILKEVGEAEIPVSQEEAPKVQHARATNVSTLSRKTTELLEKKGFTRMVERINNAIAQGSTVETDTLIRHLRFLHQHEQFDESLKQFERLQKLFGDTIWRPDRERLVHLALYAARCLHRGDLALNLILQVHQHGHPAFQSKHYFDAIWANTAAAKKSKTLSFASEATLQNALSVVRVMSDEGYIPPPFVWNLLLEGSIAHALPDTVFLDLHKLYTSRSVRPDSCTLKTALLLPQSNNNFALIVDALRLWAPHLSQYASDDANLICQAVLKPLCHVAITATEASEALAHMSQVVDMMTEAQLSFHPKFLYGYYLPAVLRHLSAPLFLAHVDACGPKVLQFNAYVVRMALNVYAKRHRVHDVRLILDAAADREIPVTWKSIEIVLGMLSRESSFQAMTGLVNETLEGVEKSRAHEVPDSVWRCAMHAMMETQQYEQVIHFNKRWLAHRDDEFARGMQLVANAASKLRQASQSRKSKRSEDPPAVVE
ncbi:hypothetical protein AeMF1_004345 [Aphanomyces euteiches]|nr:hypothetical protein AeMF1_004345 [Aphanomyces euteiches]KAH9193660.1 hypothetical protein AeNC1_004356 [Aphanomyces euteiches]